MGAEIPNTKPRWLGLVLLAALALHAVSYGRANLTQMFWSCHVATACMALGMLLRARKLVAAGWLFHIAIGIPAWLVEVVVTRGTFGAENVDGPLLATSIVVHTLPAIVGAIWLRPDFSVTRFSIALAWIIQAAMIPLSRAFSQPAFNINFAFAVWPGAAKIFPRLWMFQAAECAVCFAALLVAAFVVNAWNARRVYA